MIEEDAIIVDTSNDKATGLAVATLEVKRKTACGLCGQSRGCGNQLWGKLLGRQHTTFQALNPIQATVGQSVVVSINEQIILKSALMLYILPLFTMFVLAIIAQALSSLEFVVILAAVLGLLLGWLWAKIDLVARPEVLKQQPTIVRLSTDQDA